MMQMLITVEQENDYCHLGKKYFQSLQLKKVIARKQSVAYGKYTVT